MMFNAVFNIEIISVILLQSVHKFMLSTQYSFPGHWLVSLSHITIVKTVDSSNRGMNPGCALAKPGIEPATPCSQVLYTTDLYKKPFKNIVGKGKKQRHFFLSPLTLSETGPGFYMSAVEVF